jgi:hypothetical protein
MLRSKRFPLDTGPGGPLRTMGVAFLCLFFAGAAQAQGTSRSLDIQPGARQNGMGAAGVALIDGPSDAAWWNPAALGFARSVNVGGTRSRLAPGLDDDVEYSNGAGVVPFGRFGIGAGVTRLSHDNSGGSERSYAGSMGMRILADMSLGATLKLLRVKLGAGGNGEATGFGVDVGALYSLPVKPLSVSFGVNVQNLGPSVVFTGEDQASPLSRNIKIGGAIGLPVPLGGGFEIGGTGVLDVNQSLVTRKFHTLNVGAEGYAAFADSSVMNGLELVRIAPRLGYYYDPLGEVQDFTIGFGIRLLWLAADAAWIPQAQTLPHVLKVTSSLRFNLP